MINFLLEHSIKMLLIRAVKFLSCLLCTLCAISILGCNSGAKQQIQPSLYATVSSDTGGISDQSSNVSLHPVAVFEFSQPILPSNYDYIELSEANSTRAAHSSALTLFFKFSLLIIASLNWLQLLK